jgi:hypothetical protein
MSNESLAGLLIFIPFFLILLILAGLNKSSRKSHIERIRQSVKSLPLDEKSLGKRLEMFDRINAKVENYEVKLRLLQRLASGEEIKSRKKKGSWKWALDQEEELFFRKKSPGERLSDDISMGVVPSGVSFQGPSNFVRTSFYGEKD